MRPSGRTTTATTVLATGLAAYLLFFFRFGYAFATGDQDELLPFLYHLLDNDLFARDWFVQTQTSGIGVRSYFVWLLWLPARLLGVQPAFHLAFGALWLLVTYGVFTLVETWTDQKTTSVATTIAALGVFHKWTLGGNDLVYNMLVPEMLAWGLALLAIRKWCTNRRHVAMLMLGIAAWFQILVGVLTAGVLLVERLAADRDFLGSLKRQVLYGISFVVAGLPVLAPTLAGIIDRPAAEPDLLFYIIAPFRNPFHHMLLSFSIESIIRFGMLTALGIAAGLLLAHKRRIPFGGFLLRTSLAIVLACLVYSIFTEVWPVLIVAKFQAFKLTVILKLVLLTAICHTCVVLLPPRLTAHFESSFGSHLTPAIMAGILVVAGAAFVTTQRDSVERRLFQIQHENSPQGNIEVWARENTGKEAVFAVPPSNSSFRSGARRSIVVNYAAIPYSDPEMLEWYQRLLSMAPIEPPETGLGVKPVLDSAYHRHGTSAWLELTERFDIDYVIIDRAERESGLSLKKAYQTGDLVVYHVSQEK